MQHTSTNRYARFSYLSEKVWVQNFQIVLKQTSQNQSDCASLLCLEHPWNTRVDVIFFPWPEGATPYRNIPKIEHPRAEDSMKAWQSAEDGGEGEAWGEI